MQTRKNIDAVIVDTSVLNQKLCDFTGIDSAVIPSFYDLLTKKGILLLDHDVLHREILKHIGDSIAVNKVEKMISMLERNGGILQEVGGDVKELLGKMRAADIKKKVTDAFEKIYKRAKKLPYAKAEKVFDRYFENLPPFVAVNNKKCEFPDAFVLESLKEYAVKNPDKTILAVNHDGDWAQTLQGQANIVVAQSLEDAIKMINGNEDISQRLFPIVRNDMIFMIVNAAQSEWYNLDEYETVNDVEIADVKADDLSEYFLTLKEDDRSVLIKGTAFLRLDGSAEVYDETNSFWDNEEHEYLYRASGELTFEDGAADADFEAEIEYDPENIEQSARVASVKIINTYGVNIDLSEAETDFTPRFSDDDY